MKHSDEQLGDLLRRYAVVEKEIPHADFFNAQLMRQIRAEMEPVVKPAAVAWLWRRLILSGLAGISVAALLFAGLVLPSLRRPGYYAEVIYAKTDNPSITAVVVPKEEITVLWIDGLDYIPVGKAN